MSDVPEVHGTQHNVTTASGDNGGSVMTVQSTPIESETTNGNGTKHGNSPQRLGWWAAFKRDWLGISAYPSEAEAQKHDIRRGKTFWDILTVLTIPLVGVIVGIVVKSVEDNRVAQENQWTRDIARIQADNTALQKYIDEIAALVLNDKLGGNQDNAIFALRVVQADTILTANQLHQQSGEQQTHDLPTKAERLFTLLHFMKVAGLIDNNWQAPIFKLTTTPPNLLTDVDLTYLELPPNSAVLQDTNLTRANLTGATLKGGILTKCYITSATLTGAQMQGVHLEDAHLSFSVLEDADMTDSHLDRAEFVNAKMRHAVLKAAILTDALLTNADLTGADLTGADLTGVDLTNAILTGADLTGANLTGATVNGDQLAVAKSLNGATMPDGTKRQ